MKVASTSFSLLILTIAIGAGNGLLAHPGHSDHSRRTNKKQIEPTREWIAINGQFRERGSFVMANAEIVQIRREDSSLATLRIDQLRPEDQRWIVQRLIDIRAMTKFTAPLATHNLDSIVSDDAKEDTIVAQKLPTLLAQLDQNSSSPKSAMMPEIARAFEAFVKTKAIATRWDDRYFYVESNGIPDHPLMIGITSWQQQVPIPQKYIGENAWRIPLKPIPAKKPASTKGRFLRGAIALAVNGVPIFNPLNNRGEDAYLFGELDEFGGHCGRADDYHYHLAPVHLQKTIGKKLPIAYALDGYPIYGFEEPDGSPVKNLDRLNGHKDADGNYHYHATKEYPYLNGGFFGEVVERDDQVDPQPRAEPLRPALRPLKDAKITGFAEASPDHFRLTYDVKGRTGTVEYTLTKEGSAKFEFVDIYGRRSSETYQPRRRGPGGRDRR